MLTLITAQASDGYQEITLAVVGAGGVGKSTFIQHALDLRNPTNGPVSSTKVALSGVTYRFQLLELELNDIDYTAGQIKWPKYINSQLVPPINGVLCLYDITDQESIAEVPELLRKSILFALALSIMFRHTIIRQDYCHYIYRIDPIV
jgi:GTPase SAR1 family protein